MTVLKQNKLSHSDSLTFELRQKLVEYKEMIGELKKVYKINKDALSMNIDMVRENEERTLLDNLNKENQLLYHSLIKLLEKQSRDDINALKAECLTDIPIKECKTENLLKRIFELEEKNGKLIQKLKQTKLSRKSLKEAKTCGCTIDSLQEKLSLSKPSLLFMKHRKKFHDEIEELKIKLEEAVGMKNELVRINFVS